MRCDENLIFFPDGTSLHISFDFRVSEREKKTTILFIIASDRRN